MYPCTGAAGAPPEASEPEDPDEDPCGWKSVEDNRRVGAREPVCGYWRQNRGQLEIVLPFEPREGWSGGPKPRAVLNAARTVLTVRLPRDPAKEQVTSREKYDRVKRQTHIVFPSAVRAIEAESVHHVSESEKTTGGSRICILITKANDSGLAMWPSLSAHEF